MERLIVVTSISIAAIVCLFLTWLFWFKAKHKERLLLIEKGLELQPPRVNKKSSSLLKLGIVILGLSAGLLSINLLHSIGGYQISDAAAMSVMGVSGGISLIAANYAGKVNDK